MIDETAIRLRYEALRPSLDERGRRLFAAAEARAERGGGGDGRRAQHDGPGREGAGRAAIDGKDPPRRRRAFGVAANGPDASSRSAKAAGAGDARRSNAAVAVGVEEPRQACSRVARDGTSGLRDTDSAAA